MARLLDLNGQPMKWETLHARREAYYTEREMRALRAPRLAQCVGGHHGYCPGMARGRWNSGFAHIRTCGCSCHVSMAVSA